MEIVVMLGAPGSGKGTVSDRVAESDPRVAHVSSGDLLRGAIAQGTPAGLEAKKYMEGGNLVPDALIAEMIKDVIASAKQDVMLLDGFPRNLAQAEILAATGAKVRSAVMLDVPEDVIVERIAGRRTCPKCKAGYHVKNLPPKVEGVCDKCGAALVVRKDDDPSTVKNRLAVYHRETEPLVAYYEAKGLLRTMKGTGPLDGLVATFKSVM